MALAEHVIGYLGAGPAASLAVPTTSEVIVAPDDHTHLLVVVGVTATVVTIVVPGLDLLGIARPDQISASLTSTTRIWKIDRNYRDPATGNVSVLFSQVANVLACVLKGG